MARSRFSVAVTSVFFLTLAACSDSEDAESRGGAGGTSGVSGENDDSTDTTGEDPELAAPDGGSTGSSNGLDCSEAAKLVYVLSSAGDGAVSLHSFDPEELRFEKVGDLECGGDTAFYSMAVQRSGIGWALSIDAASLYKIDLQTADCEKSAFAGRAESGDINLRHFGMTFFGEVDAERLLISGGAYSSGGGLAGSYDCCTSVGELPLDDFEPEWLGTYPPELRGATELAGSADGQLFSWWAGSGDDSLLAELTLPAAPGGIIEISKRVQVPPAESKFAFVVYNGQFWFFNAAFGEETSVTVYDPVSDQGEEVLTDTGLKVVGAGVSLCAPSKPIIIR